MPGRGKSGRSREEMAVIKSVELAKNIAVSEAALDTMCGFEQHVGIFE